MLQKQEKEQTKVEGEMYIRKLNPRRMRMEGSSRQARKRKRQGHVFLEKLCGSPMTFKVYIYIYAQICCHKDVIKEY